MEPQVSRFMTFIPADNVAKIKKPSAIVSIKGQHNDRPNIPAMHFVHHLDFDVGGWADECGYCLKIEQIDPLIKFVEDHGHLDLYIHCTEGRIRSYTIAKLLRRHVERDLEYKHELSGPGAVLDRSTCGTWNRYFDTKGE